jgi:hypothetical protein
MDHPFTLDFVTMDIGRGIKGLYCWRSDCICPAGFVIYTACGDGKEFPSPSRNRADILHIYVPEWTREMGIGHALVNEMKEMFCTIHTPVTDSKASKSLFEDCGFTHDEESIDWRWSMPVRQVLTAGPSVDKALAVHLGWTNIEVEKTAILLGIPPGGKARIQIPNWSVDLAQSISLMIDHCSKHHLDYQWYKAGDYYSCGIRNDGILIDFDKASVDEVSGWYDSLPMSICHALLAYFQSVKMAEFMKKVENHRNGPITRSVPVAEDPSIELDRLRDESIERLRQELSDANDRLADANENIEILKATDSLVREYSKGLEEQLKKANIAIPDASGDEFVDAFADSFKGEPQVLAPETPPTN